MTRLMAPEIDRRPMTFLNAFGGRCNEDCFPEENQWCHPCWWRGPDAVETLIEFLEDRYQAGYRRVGINRPAGGGNPGGKVTSMIWETLSNDYKREEIPTLLKDFLDSKPDLKFTLFFGFQLPPDCSTRSMVDIRVPEYDTRQDSSQLHCNLNEWIKAGVQEFHFDNSSPDNTKDALLKASRLFWSGGILAGGEAIPTVDVTLEDGSSGQMIDQFYAQRAPWLFTESFYSAGPRGRSWPQWEVDPDKTMAQVFFLAREGTQYKPDMREDTPEGRAHIDDWVRRGFIPCAWTFNWTAEYIIDNYGDGIGAMSSGGSTIGNITVSQSEESVTQIEQSEQTSSQPGFNSKQKTISQSGSISSS